MLSEAYATGKLEKPINPETGKSYTDPYTDVHIIAAASMSPEVKDLVDNKPWEANKDNPIIAIWRQLGKILNYALIYLAQALTIAQQTGCTVEEAQANIDKYFAFPNGFFGLKEWLDSMAAVASELRWIRLITGELIMINESNSKGMADGNTSARKAVNHAVQGLGATQAKIALIKGDKYFEELNKKYKEILNGRLGEWISIVHDEVNSLIPGNCTFELVPDINLNEKYKVDCFVKPKVSIDKNNPEHLLAQEYGNCAKLAMEEAMGETFDIIESDIPPGASNENAPFWKH